MPASFPDNEGDIPADGAGVIVAGYRKRDGAWRNPIDPEHVAVFMQAIERARSAIPRRSRQRQKKGGATLRRP